MEAGREGVQPTPSQEGRVLDGRYRLHEPLGAGGMGVVYRGEHLKLGRAVAIKLLLSEYGEDENLRKRFDREARALAAMSHPHIVTVTDYGIVESQPYLVMELLTGASLEERLQHGPLAEPEAFEVTRQILRALAHAHVQGVAHRDLKPGNVFLQSVHGAPDHVKLLDFGLAKFLEIEGPQRAKGPALTRTGALIGTPAYMAPEQASGQGGDVRIDVYAVGVLLFEMLTGRRPFTGPTPELIRQHLIGPIPKIAEGGADLAGAPELDAFVERAMAKERQNRFADGAEMLAAFEALPRPLVTGSGKRDSDRPTRAPGAQNAQDRATAPTLAASDASAPAAGAPAPSHSSGSLPSVPQAMELTRAPNPDQKRVLLVLMLAGVVIAFVVVIAVVTAVFLVSSGEDAAVVAPGEPTPIASDEDTVEPTVVRDDTAATGNTDVWGGDVPTVLADVKTRLDAGRRISSSTDRRLMTYARRNPDDGRPYLLLARIHLARGWRPDAFERYERAHARDPRVRDDPHMLPDLVTLVAHRATSREATAFVRRVWGRDAIPALDAALAEDGLPGDDAARLRRLRSSL